MNRRQSQPGSQPAQPVTTSAAFEVPNPKAPSMFSPSQQKANPASKQLYHSVVTPIKKILSPKPPSTRGGMERTSQQGSAIRLPQLRHPDHHPEF